MQDIFSYIWLTKIFFFSRSQVYLLSEIINCTEQKSVLCMYVCVACSKQTPQVTTTYSERPFCGMHIHIQLIIHTIRIGMAANNQIISRILLMIPSSGGKPDNELFDRSRTPRCSLQASTGNSFN